LFTLDEWHGADLAAQKPGTCWQGWPRVCPLLWLQRLSGPRRPLALRAVLVVESRPPQWYFGDSRVC